jgi:DNA-binding transcriptional MerR regulator
MAETPQPIEIPNRALFKAAEVCDLVKVQPYVLRSWEAEFKDLGVTRSGTAGRIYRREDIERVLRIKHLLLIEGLTLAGVRRKLEEEAEPPLDAEPLAPSAIPLNASARERIVNVKRGLRSLLDLLDASPPAHADAVEPASAEFALAPPAPAEAAAVKPVKRSASRERAVANDAVAKPASPRRKRSA